MKLKNSMKRIIVLCCLISVTAVVFAPCSMAAKAKKDPVEFYDPYYPSRDRSNFGLVAKNVTNVKIGNGMGFGERVFITQKNKKEVKAIDFMDKVKTKSANYRLIKVANNAKDFFPLSDDIFVVDKKNRLLETGSSGDCHLFAKHTSAKQCHSSGRVFNLVVEKKVNPKKCWTGNDMFAYVKNNRLYITGEAAIPVVSEADYDYYDSENRMKCYQYDKPREFFKGKGNKVKEVVCGDDLGGRIFVLMKDGSVWGRGNNEHKFIADSKQKYYDDFVKIIPSGVKHIAASYDNVAFVNKKNVLYLWGHTIESPYGNKYISPSKPRKIAGNVKEISISGADYDMTLLFIKKNGTAYGVGDNSVWKFTEKYKKSLYTKPVKLMENVEHVYSMSEMTLVLKKNKELYWTGSQMGDSDLYWIEKRLAKK